MNSITTPIPSPAADSISTVVPVFTIGYTGKDAGDFFESLRANRVKRIVDVRVNRANHLCSFTKNNHMPYFLKTILGIDYVEAPLLAPSEGLFNGYRDEEIGWDEYEPVFFGPMKDRGVEEKIDPALLDGACLLCSEHEPDECHRRLVVEYLQRLWGNLSVTHLL